MRNNGYVTINGSKTMTFLYSQLTPKARKNAIEIYNCQVERTAPATEIFDYYMHMGSEGQPILFDINGNEIDENNID